MSRFKYQVGDIVKGLATDGTTQIHLILNHEETDTKLQEVGIIPVYRTLNLETGKNSLYGRAYINRMTRVA